MTRCAIYTRKSAAERVGKEFTSLAAQREYCSAFVQSHAGEGWFLLDALYDDGGYSGGTINRPALKRLLADSDAGKIDVVVVYKIDRLSRSLRDFVNLVERLEQCGVTFVSVTQSFNSATSMGRLTLNVLLSFAQFEREVTSERLKDWFAGARARGLWVPNRPYGYRKEGSRLVVDPQEAAVVRRVFARYIKLGSCRLVANELFRNDILGPKGRPMRLTSIRHMIRHRVYRGEIVHRGRGLPGSHEPIVSEALWQRAQAVMARSTKSRSPLAGRRFDPLLVGLLFDRSGARMHHTFTHSKGFRYRYYVAGAEKFRYGPGSDPYLRFRASDIEAAVKDLAFQLAGRDGPPWRGAHDEATLVRSLVERIDIGDDGMRVTLRTGAVIWRPLVGRIVDRRPIDATSNGAKGSPP